MVTINMVEVFKWLGIFIIAICILACALYLLMKWASTDDEGEEIK